ncbi:DNA mismatch repair protein Msh6 [Meira miltonrushii]|uniref:DNA mismatch repair protein n=1 Tax=Meira miltonrushii TaxID=1280837 RepID=A0A316V8Q7_9BASI|nr:DNA mismatch repair protein Msh6 [Meira miltonrushii]PWN33880.1 DNA mismatch repair protein Msh6 [Meira miltonrushii]
MPPSSSMNGRSSNSSSQPKQSTLFGFFGKPNAGPAPPSQRSVQQNTPGSKSIAIKSASSNGKAPNVPTPPQSVQKSNGYPLQNSSSSNTMNRNGGAHSSSPLRERSEGRISNAANQGSTKSSSMLEMTPPSSSPPITTLPAIDDDEDEEMVTRVPRRKAAIKRQVNYAESDDEFGLGGGQDDDDEKDQYKPENDRPAKKSRVQDSDDEFDDFIDLDEAELEKLESNALKSKQKKQPAATQHARPSAKPSTSFASMTSSAPVRRPMAGSSSAASLKPNQSKAQSPTEEPYEFLTNPKDKDGNPPNHPDHDKRTLHIPKATYDTLTPFEKQFWDIKKCNNDTVLFFQKGKFYELYEDDAVIAHREFGLKMTDRVRMKMAGVPESSFDAFANRFLALGYKVGRVDQAETAVAMAMRKSGTMVGKGPATAGGNDNKIVRRELKHIYTNGTIVDANCLPDEMSSYCVSIKEVIFDPKQNGPAGDKDDDSLSLVPIFGVCFLDASTAEFKMRHFEDDVSRTKLETLLRSSRIKEVLHEKGGISRRTLRILKNTVAHDCNITMLKPHDEFLDAEQTLRKLNLVYNPIYQNDEHASKKSLDSVEPVDVSILPEAIQQVLDTPEALSALGAMLAYLTQLNLEKDICASRKFDIFDPAINQTSMLLDAQSLTHLNVLVNEQGDTQGTLLNLVNRAVTPFGKRLMRIWLLTPLAQIYAITSRQEAVEALLGDSSFREDFDIFAKSLPDIERIMPRIYAGNCKSADFNRVLKSLARFDENITLFKERAGAFGTDVVQALLASIPPVSEYAQDILSKCQKGENFEPKPGHHDSYDQACDNLDEVERSLAAELVEAAKVLKLSKDRVKFKDIGTNEIRQVEVPIKVKVPDTWSLVSQTQSVKRYYPPKVRQLVKQLKEGRETKLVAFKDFQASLFEQFQKNGDQFLQAVKGIAEMDCLVSLAKASYAMGEPSCRPEFVESDTAVVDFEELRHPCMASTSTTEFIANDIALGGVQRLSDRDDRDDDEGPARVTILTGGNMAGKSTTARTTATAVILAQLGCRVPASRARLSPIDRIASRMGANDQLFRNNSTFMVEMLEASRILKDCTPRSLVIMDELGRGTSTFDGQAIAYAVLHHLIGRTRCLCFFLTHYTSLAHEFEGRYGVANKHMQVLVDSEIREVVFTYKLVDGIAESSYGTEVAALAGVPMEICDRATKISREFAATTKEAEKERMRKMGDALSVATLSDFALIFKAGSGKEVNQDSQKKKESFNVDEQALNFMRKQIATVMANRSNGVENGVSISA